MNLDPSSEAWKDIALLIYGISMAIYYARSIESWPLGLRILRQIYFFKDPSVRTEYQYGWKESITVFIINQGIFVVNVFLVVTYTLPNFLLIISSTNSNSIITLLAIFLNLSVFFMIPSITLHLIKSLIQLILGYDFVRFFKAWEEKRGRRRRKLGLSEEVARRIVKDIESKCWRNLICRFALSLSIFMFLLLALPFLLSRFKIT